MYGLTKASSEVKEKEVPSEAESESETKESVLKESESETKKSVLKESESDVDPVKIEEKHFMKIRLSWIWMDCPARVKKVLIV